MIRRDFVTPDDVTPDDRPAWLVVPQIAHAVLSGRLADAWQFSGLGSADVENDLRTAGYRHDDGWRDWDARPGIDPQSGRPVNFDEMRLADSLAIWSDSIDRAAARGPLVGYFVAGHFTRLLRRFDSWRGNAANEPLARAFLNGFDGQMAAWLEHWSQRPGDSTGDRGELSHIAPRGVSYLQLFDAISLWLCCAERHEPRRIELAEGEGWTFSPLPDSTAQRQRVRIEPWPMHRAELELSVSGWAVPRRRYQSTDELLAARIEPDVTLGWSLIP